MAMPTEGDIFTQDQLFAASTTGDFFPAVYFQASAAGQFFMEPTNYWTNNAASQTNY